MKKRLISALALLAVTGAAQAQFSLGSTTVVAGSTISNTHVFAGFGCSGGNVSPALSWKGAPADAKSFALTVYDPDAPTGSGWWHWAAYNIPASATGLAEGAGTADGAKLPAGTQQVSTDFGAPGYGGPCPPQGDKPHRYIFTVYALKTDKLELPPTATPALLGFMIHFNKIGEATFTANYGR